MKAAGKLQIVCRILLLALNLKVMPKHVMRSLVGNVSPIACANIVGLRQKKVWLRGRSIEGRKLLNAGCPEGIASSNQIKRETNISNEIHHMTLAFTPKAVYLLPLSG